MITRITAADAWPTLAGSKLVGHIDATTTDMTAALGPPDNVAGQGDCKTELRWYVRIDDTVAHIYNYHDGGRRPLPRPDAVVCWHVGAHDINVVDQLVDALNMGDTRA